MVWAKATVSRSVGRLRVTSGAGLGPGRRGRWGSSAEGAAAAAARFASPGSARVRSRRAGALNGARKHGGTLPPSADGVEGGGTNKEGPAGL